MRILNYATSNMRVALRDKGPIRAPVYMCISLPVADAARPAWDSWAAMAIEICGGAGAGGRPCTGESGGGCHGAAASTPLPCTLAPRKLP